MLRGGGARAVAVERRARRHKAERPQPAGRVGPARVRQGLLNSLSCAGLRQVRICGTRGVALSNKRDSGEVSGR